MLCFVFCFFGVNAARHGTNPLNNNREHTCHAERRPESTGFHRSLSMGDGVERNRCRARIGLLCLGADVSGTLVARDRGCPHPRAGHGVRRTHIIIFAGIGISGYLYLRGPVTREVGPACDTHAYIEVRVQSIEAQPPLSA